MNPDPSSVFPSVCQRLQGYASRMVEVCDGARSRDSQGFSKAHASIGRVLAFTPAESWTLELAAEATGVLGHYRNTQLAANEEDLSALMAAVQGAEASGRAPRGSVKPTFGVEDGKLTLRSVGYGLAAEEKKRLERLLKESGMEYDKARSAWRRPQGDEATTEEATVLKELLKLCRVEAEAEARVDKLSRSARPTTSYIAAEVGGVFRVAFPYDRALVDGVKNATSGSMRGFDPLSRTWLVNAIAQQDAVKLLEFAQAHSLVLVGETREALQKLGTAVPLPGATPAMMQPSRVDLYLAGDLLVCPTKSYNPNFNTWMKETWRGQMGSPPFSKTGPEGATGRDACPSWFLKARAAHLARPLLAGLPGIGVDAYGVRDGVMAAMETAERAAIRSNAKKEVLAAGSALVSSDVEILGLGGVLRPFQRAGVSYAVAAIAPKKGVMIGDEMGLGKTVQALATIHHLNSYPAIVVCPASVKLNWRNEAVKWLPAGKRIAVVGRGVKPTAGAADVWILNYDILAKNLDDLKKVNAASVVYDEIHYVKDSASIRARASEVLASDIDVRIGLSGTPIENRPIELAQQLQVLGRLEELGGFMNYAKRYCDAQKRSFGWDFRGSSNSIELNERLRATCYVRREKALVAKELPPKQRTIINVELSNAAEYRRCEAEFIAWLREDRVGETEGEPVNATIARTRRAEILARMTYLRRVAAEGKVAEFTSWARDFLASGQKLIVFAHHEEVQDALKVAFADLRPVAVLGNMDVAQRQAAVNAFQNDPEVKLIHCGLRSGSTGITLTAASSVALLELDWNPARLTQAEDRAHRIGQQHSVNTYYFIAPGTIDVPMWEIIEEKREIIRQVTIGEVFPEEIDKKQQELVSSGVMNRFMRSAGIENANTASPPQREEPEFLPVQAEARETRSRAKL